MSEIWRAWLSKHGIDRLPEEPFCPKCNKPVERFRPHNQSDGRSITIDVACHGEELSIEISPETSLETFLGRLRTAWAGSPKDTPR